MKWRDFFKHYVLLFVLYSLLFFYVLIRLVRWVAE